MKSFAVWSFIVLCALTGCTQQPAGTAQQNGAIIKKTPIAIYPQADHVILYVSANPTFDNKGQLTLPPHTPGIRLTSEQRKQFEASFYHAHRASGENNRVEAACFDPHHFFRYYDAKGRQVGEIQVCFCCGHVASDPEIFRYATDDDWDDEDWGAMARFLNGMKVPVDFHCND